MVPFVGLIFLLGTVFFLPSLNGASYGNHVVDRSKSPGMEKRRDRDMNGFLGNIDNPWLKNQRDLTLLGKRYPEGFLDDDNISTEKSTSRRVEQRRRREEGIDAESAWTRDIGNNVKLSARADSVGRTQRSPTGSERSVTENEKSVAGSEKSATGKTLAVRSLGSRRRRIKKRRRYNRGKTHKKQHHESMFDSTEEREREPILDIFADKFKRQAESESNSNSTSPAESSETSSDSTSESESDAISSESSESSSDSSSSSDSDSSSTEEGYMTNSTVAVVERGWFGKKKKGGPKNHGLKRLVNVDIGDMTNRNLDVEERGWFGKKKKGGPKNHGLKRSVNADVGDMTNRNLNVEERGWFGKKKKGGPKNHGLKRGIFVNMIKNPLSRSLDDDLLDDDPEKRSHYGKDMLNREAAENWNFPSQIDSLSETNMRLTKRELTRQTRMEDFELKDLQEENGGWKRDEDQWFDAQEAESEEFFTASEGSVDGDRRTLHPGNRATHRRSMDPDEAVSDDEPDPESDDEGYESEGDAKRRTTDTGKTFTKRLLKIFAKRNYRSTDSDSTEGEVEEAVDGAVDETYAHAAFLNRNGEETKIDSQDLDEFRHAAMVNNERKKML